VTGRSTGKSGPLLRGASHCNVQSIGSGIR